MREYIILHPHKFTIIQMEKGDTMGLTFQSVGKGISEFTNVRESVGKVIALAGNPNVGKSTVFNYLTGMHQHTGNWPGKTVSAASGNFEWKGETYTLVDIPGTYSFMPHSAEEEVARDFLCFGNPDAVIVVCDGGRLERNLSLVLQAAEITDRLVVCVNLMDEAERHGINVDAEKMSAILGVPVIKTSAGKGIGMEQLTEAVEQICTGKAPRPCRIKYTAIIDSALSVLEMEVHEALAQKQLCDKISSRWLSLRILENDKSTLDKIEEIYGFKPFENSAIKRAEVEQRKILLAHGFDHDKIISNIVACQMINAESIYDDCVSVKNNDEKNNLDRKLDRLFTGKKTGMFFMILLMALVFWLTITGANYPSEWLSDLFGKGEIKLRELFAVLNGPSWLGGLLIDGVYCVLTWIISVMLPPMAIFFPIFTLLEDSGYLPRVAFNLDDKFRRCNACGKQALTTCMGFGCNAAGVTGCRIIDSPRERLIAIITNSFIPCNGRFPMLTAIISMFFLGSIAAPFDSIFSALILTALILLGICMTFAVSKLLSSTVLKGVPSSFTLELPSYRRPKILSVIVRSIFDRTLFVLGRAVVVAAPAGAIIWIMANINIGGQSVLAICNGVLDPLGRLLGMDGVILMAFILGFPANEIVIPLVIMSYMAEGRLVEINDLTALRELLVNNGWTLSTALCTMLFSLMHWPCSTTCITIYKETKSLKWTAVSILIPTATGAVICFIVASVCRIFGV